MAGDRLLLDSGYDAEMPDGRKVQAHALGEGTLLLIAGSSWAYYESDEATDVRLRLGLLPNGRLEISELHISDFSPTTLRDLPFGPITRTINSSQSIREWLEVDPHHSDIGATLKPMSKFRGSDAEPPPLQSWLEPGTLPHISRRRRKSLRVSVPAGHGKRPDTFYETVMKVYAEASRASKTPAVDVAEANGVPVTSVHRWVKEARRRGLMPPSHLAQTEESAEE